MNVKTETVFEDAVTSVLEQFAFVFAEPGNGYGGFPGEYLHASITFSGLHKGSISIAAPEPLCLMLAGNVLGLDRDAAVEEAEDTMKELANVICGKVTVGMYGDREVFNLTIPSLFRIDRGKWRELYSGCENLHFVVEGMPLLAGLMVVDV